MAERKCLMTFYPTDCKDDCFNCKCGGAEATKDMYVSINNVQRVCSITGGAADTNEGKYLSEVIRNNLERMIDADVQPVKHGEWKHVAGMNSKCSVCSHYFPVSEFDSRPFDINFCPNCGARMDGDTE